MGAKSWNCENCPQMCYKEVMAILMRCGLPHEVAETIAIDYKYSYEDEVESESE